MYKILENVDDMTKININVISWFSGTILCDVEHPKFGKHKVTPEQVKYSDASYKNAMYKCLKDAYINGKVKYQFQ